MRTWREKRIDDELKRHDPKLFLKKSPKGTYEVFRQRFISIRYHLSEDQSIVNYEPSPCYIMSLTEDWTIKTQPADWGLEPISRRLREIDSWNKESVVSQMEKHNAKVDEAKARKLENDTEAFVKEWRSDFARATKDILTNSVAKIDSRRKGDRKYGSN